MAVPINKLAPTAIVMAAVSCCAWPYVFSPDAGGGQAAALAEITSAQLVPHILPPPKRDPFRTVDKAVARSSQPTKAAAKQAAGGKAATAAKSAAAAGGSPDPFSGLALNATSILAAGTQYPGSRLAVINGRIYVEGERLRNKDPSAPPCVVASILCDRVLLECAGRTATLGYANVVHAKAKHAGGPAAPAGRDATSGGSAPSPQSPAELIGAIRATQQGMEKVTKSQQALENQLEEVRK